MSGPSPLPGAPRMVSRAGEVLTLDVRTWMSEANPEDRRLLRRARGPVLDIGCGPGRHVLALAERGVPALGIDIAPAAVELARRRGAPVLRRSVFGHLPGSGRWRTALLLDGSIGIGGDPVNLLGRAGRLLHPEGRVLVEAEVGRSRRLEARVEAEGRAGEWFPWAVVCGADLSALARAAGLALVERWSAGGRWFGDLRPV